jgi:hypothetical protein
MQVIFDCWPPLNTHPSAPGPWLVFGVGIAGTEFEPPLAAVGVKAPLVVVKAKLVLGIFKYGRSY